MKSSEVVQYTERSDGNFTNSARSYINISPTAPLSSCIVLAPTAGTRGYFAIPNISQNSSYPLITLGSFLKNDANKLCFKIRLHFS